MLNRYTPHLTNPSPKSILTPVCISPPPCPQLTPFLNLTNNHQIDFPPDDKPWRRPGTDISDYFNYTFDEFTWASYCLKQSSLRAEVLDSKKQMEEMQSMLSAGFPGLPAPPPLAGPGTNSGGGGGGVVVHGGGGGGGSGGMVPGGVPGGVGGIPPEMQALMAQMISQGVDISQMDPGAFMQGMMGAQGGNNGVGGNNGQQGMFAGQFGPGQGGGPGGGQGQGQGQGQQFAFGRGGSNAGGGQRGGGGQGRRNW